MPGQWKCEVKFETYGNSTKHDEFVDLVHQIQQILPAGVHIQRWDCDYESDNE